MSNAFFNSLMQGMKEALAHARGEITLPTRYIHVPEAELEQHSAPNREGEGSTPSGNSNSDNL